MDYEIFRRYPWDSVPIRRQVVRRWGRYYYLLTMYLRKYPPDKFTFRIKTLMDEFDHADYQTVYQTLREYIEDSKFFLRYIEIPETAVRGKGTWAYAIDELHKTGFYMIQPTAYHSGWWGEPSFSQFENYDGKYLTEAFNRALNRLRDGLAFGLTFDGLDIRQELEYIKIRRLMLEDKSEEEEEDGV